MYSNDRLNDIFDRTDGRCHLCGKKLCFSNYDKQGKRGNWEVEHSIPKSQGGTDRLNNLYAACISCNRAKGAKTTRSSRASNGISRAPYSKSKKAAINRTNTIGGGLIGLGCTALMTSNPVGLAVGVVTGALLGNSLDPEDS